MNIDAAMQQIISSNHLVEGFAMFSLISLYFAYRRDVVTAERYVAGLAKAQAQAQPVVDRAPVQADPLPLAA